MNQPVCILPFATLFTCTKGPMNAQHAPISFVSYTRFDEKELETANKKFIVTLKSPSIRILSVLNLPSIESAKLNRRIIFKWKAHILGNSKPKSNAFHGKPAMDFYFLFPVLFQISSTSRDAW